MPSETENEARSSAPKIWIPEEAHLFVVLEGERPYAGGARYALRDLDEVSIQRTDGNALEWSVSARSMTLGIPDRRISGRHARLVRSRRGWEFEDAASTNGSFVNGARVSVRMLVDGDLLELGRTLLRYRSALPTPSDSPAVRTGADDRTGSLGLGTLLPALARELSVLARVSASNVPILLLGETGAGKEVVARAIHAASGRPGPLVPVNCAALPDALVESELFGHVKGAFSGAARDEVGFVRAADGGTLFLDEIGDLPRAAQAVLLRVLQESEVVPVGSSRPQRVDLRVLAATHQPIEAMIARGEFRADLYARLRGFTHRLWPLRDRKEDLGLLLAELLPRGDGGAERRVRIAMDAARSLVQHDWPLNVRELAQALTRALAIADEGVIELETLGPLFAPAPISGAPPEPSQAELSADDGALRELLVAKLRVHEGNVAAAARALNKAPMQVYRWMRRLNIDPNGFRAAPAPVRRS